MTVSVCIIQARRQSTRLPDKILLPLRGKPVLQHVIDRCRNIPGIDEVIVAAPTGTFEDPVEVLAVDAGALTYRGSMDDVLGRYWGAANLIPCDYVMRVTADCPLIDPSACGALVQKVKGERADFGALHHWPHGLDCEFFTHELLDAAYRNADKPVDREHVTLWMKAQDTIRKVSLQPEGGKYHSGNRWVVDYPEDYEFLTALFEHVPEALDEPSYKDILAILEQYPQLREINSRCEEEWAKATKKLYAESGQDWEKPA